MKNNKKSKQIADQEVLKNKNTNKPKAIDVSQIDLDLMKKKTVDLPGLIEFAHSVGGFHITPTEQGLIKSQAMEALKGQTQMQLDLIFEQMKLLAKQAKSIQSRISISQQIYEADLNFKPSIGKHYFLYQRDDRTRVLSLVAPEEWSSNQSIGIFVAEVELMADHTWKVIREEKPEEDNQSDSTH